LISIVLDGRIGYLLATGMGKVFTRSEKGRKPTKGRGSDPEGSPSPAPAAASAESGFPVRELSGWLLVGIALVSLVAVLSDFAQGGGDNILGPWLGGAWASILLRGLGRLPVLLFLPALGWAGLGVLQLEQFQVRWRRVVFLLLLCLELAVLLSIRYLTVPQPTVEQFETSGGLFGNFLVHFLFVPLFGTHALGAWILSLGVLFATVVWGTSFRLSTWVDRAFAAARGYRELRKQARALAAAAAGPLTEALPIQQESNAPRIIDPPPVDPRVNATLPLPTSALPATLETAFPSVESEAGADTPGAAGTAGLSNEAALQPREELLGDEGLTEEDLELFRKRAHANILQRLTPEQREQMDPRDLSKLLEEEAEIERAHARNRWRMERKGNIEIGGLLAQSATQGSRTAALPQTGLEAAVGSAASVPGPDESAMDPDEALTRKFEVAAIAGALPVGAASPGATAQAGTAAGNSVANASAAPRRPLPTATAFRPNEAPTPTRAPSRTVAARTSYAPSSDQGYKLPDLKELLPEPPHQEIDFTQEELQKISRDLEGQLSNFRVQGSVKAVTTGPVITRFEVELAPGVKVSSIANLGDDLALALKADSIRILAPIPGTARVGIEVPNKKAQMVYFRSMLDANGLNREGLGLPIALGRDIAGRPFGTDLTKAPHLLIAGATGSGKSVCINTLMASILATRTPDEVRMLLVDPKVVELKLYENIPHLLYPVITAPEEAVQALNWACWEMDRRYNVLGLAKVRNLAGYNDKQSRGELPPEVPQAENRRMPYIIVMIDELADLMMTAGKDVEKSIARIAQKARAVGIHLVLATQRPDTKVITGTIKANLPTRIAFRVSSHIDARTIMDRAGAEKLLGRGDMLFLAGNKPDAERVHGAFLSDEDVEKIALAASNQGVDYPQLATLDVDGAETADSEDDGQRDDLFNEAAEMAVNNGSISTSHVQRRLGVGFARAGRIVDQLEKAGVVGKAKGSKPREVLLDEEQLRSFLSGDVDRLILDDEP